MQTVNNALQDAQRTREGASTTGPANVQQRAAAQASCVLAGVAGGW